MPHFIFIQQISVLNILNILYNLHFFYSKRRLFHNATLFGFCINHVLNTGVLKFEEKKSVAKRLNWKGLIQILEFFDLAFDMFSLNIIYIHCHRFGTIRNV